MQYAIVQFSELNLSDRIDAEYYQPFFLNAQKRLEQKNAKELKNYCDKLVGSAFYPAATQLYEHGDMPFIRCVDAISYPVITSNQDHLFAKIPTEFADANDNIKKLKSGDIVITKVGTPCYASVIHNIPEVALSRTVLGLEKIGKIDPYYLVVFLRSKYGYSQLLRARELTIQYQLTLDRVGNILVYKPCSTELELLISQCLKKYEEYGKKAQNFFNDAQNILLAELNLHWQPKHTLSFIKKFSDTQQAERFDAEYFQPKYEEIILAIKSYSGGWDTLGNLFSMKKGIEVGSAEYIELGVPFARVSNLSPFELSEEKYISDELYEKLHAVQPQQGEILLSKDATPGIAYYIHEQPSKMIISGGILRLKSKGEQVYPEVATLLLNSILVQEQMKQDCGGSVILHWRPEQIAGTILPIFSKDVQDGLRAKVVEATTLRQRSKQLLEYAKRAVEMAIEENEATALSWLEAQTKALL